MLGKRISYVKGYNKTVEQGLVMDKAIRNGSTTYVIVDEETGDINEVSINSLRKLI